MRFRPLHVLLCLTLIVGSVCAAEDPAEVVDPLPDEGCTEIAPADLSRAINEVSGAATVAFRTQTAPSAAVAPAPGANPSGAEATFDSLRRGMRQADLRMAVTAQDAKAVRAAIDRLFALSGDEPGRLAQKRRGRLLELSAQGKWRKAMSLTNTMTRDRRRVHAARNGANQGTMLLLGSWLRFAQLGGTARCGSTGTPPAGPLVRPVMTGKVAEGIAALPAAFRTDAIVQRTTAAFAQLQPLAVPAVDQTVTKEAGCRIKEGAAAALAGL